MNRCFGLGERGMQEWRDAHGFSSVPEPLMRYHGDIQKGMDIDMQRHGDKARKIQLGTESRCCICPEQHVRAQVLG